MKYWGGYLGEKWSTEGSVWCWTVHRMRMKKWGRCCLGMFQMGWVEFCLKWDSNPFNKTATAGPSYTKGWDVWYVMGSRKKHDVIFIATPDVVWLGLTSDNHFQPITRFVSIAMLGNEIVVGVTFHGYGGKHVTCCLWEWGHYLYFLIFSNIEPFLLKSVPSHTTHQPHNYLHTFGVALSSQLHCSFTSSG